MSRIFISHSSTDNAKAEAFAKWLEENGWADFFLDFHHTQGLAPGERWQEALRAAADRCEAVVFLISPAWRDSRWCLAEFLLAKQLGKTIFGVLIEPTPLETLPAEMTAEWQLSDWTTDILDGQARLKFGLEKAGLDPATFPWPPTKDPSRAPYRGLHPLQAEDAAIMFGRKAETVRGLDAIRRMRSEGRERFMVIQGASGAGKSSFLRAGLLPRLDRDTRHFLPLPILRPGRAALTGETGLAAGLERTLAKYGSKEPRGVISEDIRHRGSEALRERLETIQSVSKPFLDPQNGSSPTIILPIDQAEELNHSNRDNEADIVLDALGPLLVEPVGQDPEISAAQRRLFATVVTIRTDSYAELQDVLDRIGVTPRLFDLPAISPSDYRSIIEGPAERATAAGRSLEIEPALTERLLADTDGSDALALLAFTLERLYLQFGAGSTLRLSDYEQLGGVRGSIEASVNEAFAEFSRQMPIPVGTWQSMLRHAFIPWLVKLDGPEDRPLRSLARFSDIPEISQPSVDHLVEARLLRSSVEDGERVIEVAHEALLRQWPLLESWLFEEGTALRLLNEVKRAAAEWSPRQDWQPSKSFGGGDDWLVHRGNRLASVTDLLAAKEYQEALGDEGLQYLEACRALERDEEAERIRTREREQQRIKEVAEAQEREQARIKEVADVQARTARSQRRNLLLNLVMSAVVIVAMAGAVIGFRTLHREQSLALTTAALQAADEGFYDRGLRLAVLANEGDWLRPASTDAEGALGEIAFRSNLRFNLGQPDKIFTDAVYSADGRRILTKTSDFNAQVWDLDQAGLWSAHELAGHTLTINSAGFSPDGSRVVTASSDRTVRVWSQNEEGTWSSIVLRGHTGPVQSATFSPDGTDILSVGSDTQARIWQQDDDGGWYFIALEGHSDELYTGSFSSDGRRVITGSWDKTARIWDITGNVPLAIATLEGHTDFVGSAHFSPDNERVVTASYDGTARVWTQDDREDWDSIVLGDHSTWVYAATFSSDGRQILTLSDDATARTWVETPDGEWISRVIDGEGVRINSAVFSPDESQILTASQDGFIRIWKIGSEQGDFIWSPTIVGRHGSGILSAVFSPDGAEVLTTGRDVRAWDIPNRSPPALAELVGHESRVVSAGFSPNSRQVVTASDDYTARVWTQAADGTWTSDILRGHTWWVKSAEFSPDGAEILTFSQDLTARVWRKSSDGDWEDSVLSGHRSSISSAVFSPDGDQVLSAASDGTIWIWVRQPDNTWIGRVLEGLEQNFASADFSPNGDQILSISRDAYVWEQDAQGQWRPLRLEGHTDRVESGVFSPDGRSILTASIDGTARIWTKDSEGVWSSVALQDHEGGAISATYSKDGRRILTVSRAAVRIWTRNQRNQWMPEKLIGDMDFASSAQFSPSGELIVTQSPNNTGRIWREEASGMWSSVTLPLPHNARFRPLFSADGQILLAADEAGNTPILVDIRWLKSKASWRANETQSRPSAVCGSLLGNTYTERVEPETDASTIVFPERILTVDDTQTVGLVRSLAGLDVCKQVLDPPPWWHALAFWR